MSIEEIKEIMGEQDYIVSLWDTPSAVVVVQSKGNKEYTKEQELAMLRKIKKEVESRIKELKQ